MEFFLVRHRLVYYHVAILRRSKVSTSFKERISKDEVKGKAFCEYSNILDGLSHSVNGMVFMPIWIHLNVDMLLRI